MSFRDIDVPSFLTKSKLNGDNVEVLMRECFSTVLDEGICFQCLKACLSKCFCIMRVNLEMWSNEEFCYLEFASLLCGKIIDLGKPGGGPDLLF